MQLGMESLKAFIKLLGFTPVNGLSDTYSKKYPQHSGYAIGIDIAAGRIKYTDSSFDEANQIYVAGGTTSNFSQDENLVVLECVNRLLEKGYTPASIALEKVYPSGHGHSGRLDILIASSDGKAFLMIECKTWGREYEKERKKMLADGGQIFTYYKNAVAARHLCLYSSRFAKNKVDYINSIVDVQEEWVSLSEVKDIYEHWNKTFKNNGVFESYASPYNIVHKRLTYGDLENMREEDSGKIFNHIMEILRHNGISDKPNAFNKLLNLFVCKIIDEDKNPDDELQFQCWDGLSDEKLQMTLNDLYKEGMWRFLEIRVIDHSESDVNNVLQELGIGDTAHKKKLMDMFSDTRLKKSPNFAFVEVQDEKTFRLNAKVVREIVELLQQYKFRYEQKHEFLGDFFEKMLNTSMKQEAGQFFTPVPITRFIISALPLQEFAQNKIDNKESDVLPTVIDYACGSGHFLTEFMSKMQTIIENVDISEAPPRVRGKLNSWRGDVKFSWANEYVYGIDFDNRLVKTTKVSAFFNGDGEATIIWGNGLDNFEYSEEYRDKLKILLPNKKDNGQFDILISNPPYSVQAFKSVLKFGGESFDLFNSLTDNSSEIECLFVERMKQLLKNGGWAGVILPSSMLSNGGIYSRAREIIFKYFKVKSIVEMGSGTFMKTGTNTIILFLERRSDNDHESINQAIATFFSNKRDVTVLHIEHAFSKFVANVYDNLAFDDYVSFIGGNANAQMRAHELWFDFAKEFGDAPYEKAFEVEREKMLYFLLTCEQDIVLVKSGQKQEEKKFLGYEFSERRGYEGIRYLPDGTMLFDENDSLNSQKINSYVYNAFLNSPPMDVDEAVAKHVSYGCMSGYFEYGTSKFSKRVNLNKKGRVILASDKHTLVQLDSIADITKGQTITAAQTRTGNIPVVAGGLEPSVYHDVANREANIISVSASGANAGYVRYWNTSIFASDCNTIKAKNEEATSTKFIYVCLKSIQQEIFGLQTGQAQPHVYERDLCAIKLPLPPFNIQLQIVADFEAVDAEIERVRTNIRELHNDVESKFIEMFATTAKGYRSWPVKKIEEISIDMRTGPFGSALLHSEFVESGIFVLGIDNAVENHFSYNRMRYITEEKYEQLKRYTVYPDDVIITIMGTIGRSAVIPENFPKAINTKHLACLTLNKDISNPHFICYAFQHHPILLEQLRSQTKGAIMDGLNLTIIKNLQLSLPPLQMQNQFVDFLKQTSNSNDELQQILAVLNKKKNAILGIHL